MCTTFGANTSRTRRAISIILRRPLFRASNHSNLAPEFIAVPEVDPTRDDTEAYGRKLAAAGIPVEMVRYPGAVHGFVSWLGVLPAAQQAIDDVSSWLRRRFDGNP